MKFYLPNKFKQHPPIVYKYRIWDNIDLHKFQKRVLTDNEIYLSSPDQFNDPFDSTLPFQYKKRDLKEKKIYAKMYSMACTEWPHLTHLEIDKIIKDRINSGAFKNGNYSNEWHDNFIKSINAEIGIYSLSENNSNILMWSHYADSHKGYCIGLDYNILAQTFGSIGPVTYTNKFPRLSMFPKSATDDFIRLFITKSKDWEYEREIRIINRFKARQIIRIPDECIREVILGYKMGQNSKDEIIRIIESKSTPIEIFEAKINKEKYKLDLIKIKNSR